MGNGFSEYNQSPTDPHNRRILGSMKGILNEHFAAFEQVNHRTGALYKDKMSDVLDNIEWASTSNSSNQVFSSFWAGHYVGFSSGPGWLKDGPSISTTPSRVGPTATQELTAAGLSSSPAGGGSWRSSSPSTWRPSSRWPSPTPGSPRPSGTPITPRASCRVQTARTPAAWGRLSTLTTSRSRWGSRKG